MGITELAEIIRRGCDEDERIALAATFEETHPHGNHWQWGEVGTVPAPVVRDGYLRGNGGLSPTVSLVTVETYDAEGLPFPAEALRSASRVHGEVAVHIARHDPARVLAEVAGKRALLDEALGWRHDVHDDSWFTCQAATDEHDGGTYAETDGGGPCTCGRDARVLAILTHLAQPYQETT